MQKKIIVRFVLKSIIWYIFFLLPWTTGGLSLYAAWSRIVPWSIIVPNIPNIAKIITDLWINFRGNWGRERFLGVPFWISLWVLGVVCTSQGMIRGWSLWLALTMRCSSFCVRYLHLSLNLGWEFRFLVLISGTPIQSKIPDLFPIPKIPVGIVFWNSNFWKVRKLEFWFAIFGIPAISCTGTQYILLSLICIDSKACTMI